MSMIEVDPKLFITCRLCLDEMGLYQIVPKVQMQIKYCFEIDVQPFDGLPQLICKKCESILSQYAGIKQIYQVKQNSLKTIKKTPQEVPEDDIEENEKNNTQQQQDTVSSTQQVENMNGSTSSAKKTNKHKLSLAMKVPSVDSKSSGSKSNDHATPIKPTATKKPVPSVLTDKPQRETFAWAGNYTKQFVCRICSKHFLEEKFVISHIIEHKNFIKKYSSVLNTHCEIKMNKVGSTFNLTNTEENVVFSKNKIINSVNSKYYILYTSNLTKESSSSESDDELIRNCGKYKRQRLISEASNNSTTIMTQDSSHTSIDIEEQPQVNNSIDGDDQKSNSFIDCVNIDSDSTSTQSNQTTNVFKDLKPQQNLFCVNKKLISNIITMSYKKYLNRFDNSKNDSKLHGNMNSFLQHKVLSMGTKIIHSKGLNSTGLLRYLEHKNLDIIWTQSKNSNSPIIVKTSLVNAKSNDNDINDLGWKSFNEIDQNHKTRDFIDIFENLPPEEVPPSLEDSKLFEETSQLDSNEHNIEKELSTNISQTICNEKAKNLKTIIINTPTQSKVTESSENAVLVIRSVLECDKQSCTKILNANPVPYPKQLPTKKPSVHEPTSTLKSPTRAPVPIEVPHSEAPYNFNKNVVHMPVITSTVSLASLAKDQKQKQSNSMTSQVTPSNKGETNLPQIKVKSMSELMPDKSVQNNPPLVNMAGWSVASSNPKDSIVLHAHPNLVYVANVPQYTSVRPQQSAALCYPQILTNNSQVRPGGAAEISRHSGSNERPQRKGNQEFVHMHTVELPNTKTSAPFRYFQKLLQIHHLILLESTIGISYISTSMKCLIKFSLGFQQENNAPVTLCLTLYCDKNVFCIKVRDNASKDIDVSKLSANWQWEILKVFKSDIVNKLKLNALKHGLDMSYKVNHFVSLLNAIKFTKENN